MYVLIVGEGSDAASFGEALRASDVAVERRGDGPPSADGPAEIAEIARELRELEAELGDGGADAVLTVSHSAAALAAVLVATKLGIPVARLESRDDAAEESANARLIRQLSDTALAPDPAAIVEWARASYAART